MTLSTPEPTPPLTDDELERVRDLADDDIATVRDMRLILAELERLHSWDGLMALLDEHWPEDIFPTRDDDKQRDPGPRIVSLLRWVDRLRAELEAVKNARAAEADEYTRQLRALPGWCRACPPGCVSCLGPDCECYEHQDRESATTPPEGDTDA